MINTNGLLDQINLTQRDTCDELIQSRDSQVTLKRNEDRAIRANRLSNPDHIFEVNDFVKPPIKGTSFKEARNPYYREMSLLKLDKEVRHLEKEKEERIKNKRRFSEAPSLNTTNLIRFNDETLLINDH